MRWLFFHEESIHEDSRRYLDGGINRNLRKLPSKYGELSVMKCLSAKILKHGYRYHKLRKAFSKFYRPHYELISKFNVGLKSLLHQGLSEPKFYGDLVYKFEKIIGRTDFSD